MIYFLINNNFHFDLDVKLARQLPGHELGLIQVPYSLDIIKESEVFSNITFFSQKIIGSLWGFLIHPVRNFSIQKEVRKKLKPFSDDILLVHTDMDLLNQYIIQLFYKANAKVFLVEDGTSTMSIYNLIAKKAPVRDRIRSLILRKIYRFEYTKYEIYGQQLLPVMKDHIFKGVIVNFGDSILRKIPLFKMTPVKEPFNISYEEGAIFFNQALYMWYLKEDEYISYIESLLVLSKEFNPFFFKFHPSDIEYIRKALTKIINEKFNNITIIPENDFAEKIICKYPVRYAITFTSSSALNLINKGIVPIFLTEILYKTFPDSTFEAFSQFLRSINCMTPLSLSDVRPGFRAFPDELNKPDTKSLIEILG
jgi:hypothetical protein